MESWEEGGAQVKGPQDGASLAKLASGTTIPFLNTDCRERPQTRAGPWRPMRPLHFWARID